LALAALALVVFGAYDSYLLLFYSFEKRHFFGGEYDYARNRTDEIFGCEKEVVFLAKVLN